MKKMKFCVLSCLLALCVVKSTYADSDFAGQWYQVDLIIYSQINAANVNDENWPPIQPNQLDPSKMITLRTAGNQSPFNASNYQLLTNNYSIMKHVQANLQQRTEFPILLHLTWVQKINTASQAKPIHIYGGSLYDASGRLIADADSSKGQLPSNYASGVWEIDGSLTLSVEKYLKAVFNLQLAEPTQTINRYAKQPIASSGGLTYFRIMQSRRMRSDEVNYIDHPLYGILIKISHIKRS